MFKEVRNHSKIIFFELFYQRLWNKHSSDMSHVWLKWLGMIHKKFLRLCPFYE
jgi:hypothetical protein